MGSTPRTTTGLGTVHGFAVRLLGRGLTDRTVLGAPIGGETSTIGLGRHLSRRFDTTPYGCMSGPYGCMSGLS